jgi:hypothetical protein
MSSSESDFDDEDLSAPPKRPQIKETLSAKDISAAINDSADDTVDEGVNEISPDEYHASVKRKQDSVSPKVHKYSPIVRRQAQQGMIPLDLSLK